MAEKKMSKKVKTIIAILLALLILTAGALAVRVVYLNYFKDNTSTMVVPDNLIGEEDSTSDTTSAPDASNPATDDTDSSEPPNESTGTETTVPEASAPTESTGTNNGNTSAETKAAVIELYKGQHSDNEKFQVQNMLPGDTEVKYFAVKVSHHADAIVYFNAVVTEQTKNLADVLHIKVTHLENGKVIYDGTFADMNIDGYGETFATTQKTETVAYYKIEVSLPTSAGNEYQAAKLLADFTWTVKDTGALDSPQTGDNSNIMLYFIVMCCSLAVIIILMFTKRREREVDGNAN